MSLRKSLLPNRETSSEVNADVPEIPATGSPAPTTPAFEGLMGRSSPDSQFNPSEAQSRVKSRFWSRWNSASVPTLADIKKLTNSGAIDSWMKQSGFLDWFLNQNAAEEKIAHLADLSLSALQDLILNTDPKSQGARVQAIKLVVDLFKSLQEAQKGAQEREKEKVKGMSKDELLELLKANLGPDVSLITQLTIPASPESHE